MTGTGTAAALDRPAVLDDSARALAEAERSRTPIRPLSHAIPDLSEAEAYRIAARTRALTGAGSVGYKLGYTSAAMRAQMGIDTPNYGVLRQGTAVDAGARAPVEALIHPLVEPELTFLMGRDLAGPGIDRAQAWQAVEAVFASLEIVDTRYETYDFRAVDNIADNSSAARFVLGTKVARDRCPDLRAMPVRLLADGREIDAGEGANALGDPVLALTWLAGTLAAQGMGIPAGALVMTGGLTRAHPARAGAAFAAAFDGLGTVDLRF